MRNEATHGFPDASGYKRFYHSLPMDPRRPPWNGRRSRTICGRPSLSCDRMIMLRWLREFSRWHVETHLLSLVVRPDPGAPAITDVAEAPVPVGNIGRES